MASIKKIEGKNGVSYKITVSCGYDIKGKKNAITAAANLLNLINIPPFLNAFNR